MRMITIAALLALSGCAAAGPEGRTLGAGAWRAVDINGFPVAATPPVTLQLGDGKASGSAGCNSFSGTYDLKPKEGIRFGPLATTRMACEAAVMEQEQRFLSILAAARGYSYYGDGSLSLIAPDGRAIRFRRS
jgi:heat shock protein HslJ